MLIADIVAAVETVAPLDFAAAWDASGPQVAALRREASRMAVCLDPRPASLASALAGGAQFILSHHPLALKPALPNRLDAYHESLRLLFGADVPLYAAHTSLDVNGQGPAGWLARELGLTRLAVLEPVAPAGVGGLAPGYGLAGDLPQPRTVSEIVASIARHASLPAPPLACGPAPARVSRVAYCTGSGASLLAEAQACGAELFITGDVKYHAALEAGICLLDVGHHSLEEEMMRRMAQLLATRLPGLEVFFVPSASPFRPVPAA